MVKRAFWLLSPFSICREPISVDIAASHRIFLLSASVPGVSFHGMDNAIFAVFHNTHMVNRPICASIKKDDISGHRLIVSILPLSLCFEPVHAVGAERKLRNNPRFDVAVFLRGTLRAVITVFCLVLHTHIGILHALSGHGGFIYSSFDLTSDLK